MWFHSWGQVIRGTPFFYFSHTLLRLIIIYSIVGFGLFVPMCVVLRVYRRLYLKEFRRRDGKLSIRSAAYEAFGSVANLIFLAIAALLSWWYRWSVKSTFALTFILICFTSGSFKKTEEANVTLQLIRDSATTRLHRFVYSIVGSLFILKYVLMIAWREALIKLSHQGGPFAVANEFVQPMVVSAWQLGTIVIAGITLALYFYSDNELIRRKAGHGHSDSAVVTKIGWMKFIRGTLSVYTFSMLVWIVFRLAMKLEPFPVEWHWHP